jgi:hypothetical protein
MKELSTVVSRNRELALGVLITTAGDRPGMLRTGPDARNADSARGSLATS